MPNDLPFEEAVDVAEDSIPGFEPETPAKAFPSAPPGFVTESEIEAPPGFAQEAEPAPVDPKVTREQAFELQSSAVKRLLQDGTFLDHDKTAAALAIGTALKIPADVVYSDIPRWQKQAALAGDDVRKFVYDDPVIAKFILENPNIAPLVPRWTGAGIWDQIFGFAGHEWARLTYALESVSAEQYGRKDAEGKTVFTPPPMPDLSEHYFKPKKEMLADSPENGITGEVLGSIKQTWLGIERSIVGYQAMNALARGDDVAPYLFKAQKLELEMEKKYRGDSGLVNFTEVVGPAIVSQGETFRGMGLIGGAAAIVGAVGGAVATKSVKGAVEGGKALGAIGVKVGGFYSTYRMEAGGAFLDVYGKRTPNGTLIDADTARGFSAIYGVLSAGYEMEFMGPLMKSLGFAEVSEAIKKGTGKAALRELMGRESVTRFMKDLGVHMATNLPKTMFAEGSEEGVQGVLGYLQRAGAAGYAENKAAGDELGLNDLFRYADTQEAKQEFVDSFWPGAVGGGFLHGAGSTVHLTSGLIATEMNMARGVENAAVVSKIAGIATSEVATAAPDAAVKLAKEHSQLVSGAPLTHMYVRASKFVELVGQDNAEEVALTMFGENGVQKLHDAMKLGGFLDIPIESYVSKWGQQNPRLTDGLAQHTTTDTSLLTPFELSEKLPEIQAEAARLVKESKENPDSRIERMLKEYGTQIKEALAEAKKSKNPNAADAIGSVSHVVDTFRNVIYTLAARSGVDAISLAERYLPTVRLGTPDAIAEVMARFEDSTQAAEAPTPKGRSALLDAIRRVAEKAGVPKVTDADLRSMEETLPKGRKLFESQLQRMVEKYKAQGPAGAPAPPQLHSAFRNTKTGQVVNIGQGPHDANKLSKALGHDDIQAADFLLGDELDSWEGGFALPGSPDFLTRAEAAALMNQKGELNSGALGAPEIKLEITDKTEGLVVSAPTESDSRKAASIMAAAAKSATAAFQEMLLNPKTVTISTILHENAHIYMDMMQNLAAMPGANPQIVQDWAALQAWFEKENPKAGVKIHREQFAVSMEQYFMRGIAPSAELAPAFSRFRRWLTRIWGRITEVRAFFPSLSKLNPQVTEIFDRLLATDQEIERMAMWRLKKPLLRGPEEFKVMNPNATDEDWRRYVKLAAEWYDATIHKGERKAIENALAITKNTTDEVYERYRQRAITRLIETSFSYRFWDLLTRGVVNRQGMKSVKFDEAPKMNRAQVVSRVDEVTLKKLEPYLADNGTDIFVLGEMVGAKDPTTLLSGVASLSPELVIQEVEKSARRMMAKDHVDLLNDQAALREAVADSMHGPEDLAWLEHELRMLRSSVAPGPGGLSKVAIKLAAERMVGEMQLSELDDRVLLRNERSAHERALQAVLRKDAQSAFFYKQQQMLYAQMYDFARKARTEKLGFKKLLKKMNDDDRQSAAHNGHPTLGSVIDQVLEALGQRTPPPPGLEPRPTVVDAVNVIETELLMAAFDPASLYARIADPTEWDVLSVNEMRNVRSALKQMWELARKRNKVLIEGREETIAEVNARIAEDAASEPLRAIAPSKDYGYEQIKWNLYQMNSSLRASRLDPQILFKRLGPTAHQFFWKRYIDSRNREAELSKTVLREFSAAMESLPKKMLENRDEPVLTDLPYEEAARRDRKWLWMVMLNWGNQGNRDRLLEGRGWTVAQVEKLFKDNNVTKQEWDFVQKIWDMFDNTLWPEMSKTYARQNGVEPRKVEAIAIPTDHGVYRGGYFPIRYVPDSKVALDRQKAYADNNADPGQMLYDEVGSDLAVQAGFTQDRSKLVDSPLNLNWNVVQNHVVNVVHYIAFDALVRDAHKQINTPEFIHTVKTRMGIQYMEQIKSWLRVVATNHAEGLDSSLSGAHALLGYSRTALSISTLGYNLSVAMGDIVGPLRTAVKGRANGGVRLDYIAGSTLRGAKDLGMAFAGAISGQDYQGMRARAMSLSGELPIRSEKIRHKLNRELKHIKSAARTMPGKMYQAVKEYAWFFMEMTDIYSSTVIWDAAFNENLDRGMTEQAAAWDADERVRMALPSHASAEMPAFLRSRQGLGAFVAFFSYFNKEYNIQRTTWHPVTLAWSKMGGGESNADVGSAAWNKASAAGTLALTAARAMAYTVAGIAVTNVLGELLAGRGREEDESYEQWIARKMLAGTVMTIPVAGQVGEELINRAVSGKNKHRELNLRAAPGVALFDRALDTLTKAASPNTEEWEKYIIFTEIVMGAAQLPGRQFGKSSNYLWRLSRGEVYAEDFGAKVSGALLGETKRRPETVFTGPRQ